MTQPFAALQEDLSAEVVGLLADAEADFGGGRIVPGLFRNPSVEGLGGMFSGSKPSIEVQTSALVGIDRRAPVSIGGVQYTVYDLRPDAGMTIVDLEPAR